MFIHSVSHVHITIPTKQTSLLSFTDEETEVQGGGEGCAGHTRLTAGLSKRVPPREVGHLPSRGSNAAVFEMWLQEKYCYVQTYRVHFINR